MNKKRYILRDSAVKDALKVCLDVLTYDPPMQVIVEPYKKNRSLAQNNLMWLWLTEIAKFLDIEHGVKTTPEDLKHEFQSRYLGKKIYYNLHGDLCERTRGTSKLNTAEFTEFLNRIEAYAGSELGMVLPHPEDIWYEAMGK